MQTVVAQHTTERHREFQLCWIVHLIGNLAILDSHNARTQWD